MKKEIKKIQKLGLLCEEVYMKNLLELKIR